MGEAWAKKSVQEWLEEWAKAYPELESIDLSRTDPTPVTRFEFLERLTFFMSARNEAARRN